MTTRDFDLLREIYQEVKDLREDLRSEFLAGHSENQKRIVELEKFQSNLMGKIGMGVLLVGGAVTFAMSFIADWIKSRL